MKSVLGYSLAECLSKTVLEYFYKGQQSVIIRWLIAMSEFNITHVAASDMAFCFFDIKWVLSFTNPTAVS